MARTRPPYPAEFRQQMIELARAGRTPAELAREFGVTAQTITNWVGADGRDARRGKRRPKQFRHTLRRGSSKVAAPAE
jgi:transposase